MKAVQLLLHICVHLQNIFWAASGLKSSQKIPSFSVSSGQVEACSLPIYTFSFYFLTRSGRV